MDNDIDQQLEFKRINDKIMVFAQSQTKVTETKTNKGQVISSVQAMSKSGAQNFKYQEIMERREAIAEK